MKPNNIYLLVGPFAEALTMADLPLKGALKDAQLNIIRNAALLLKGDRIEAIDDFSKLEKEAIESGIEIVRQEVETVVVPGLVDAHTHIAFAGTRANDFALRNEGSTYLEIAKKGGGIWSTVADTRATPEETIVQIMLQRAEMLMAQGITTIEVKSGYGLSVDQELKILRAIQKANTQCNADLVATCLAAHMLPKDFKGTHEAYLKKLIDALLPVLKAEALTHRIDAFIEESAFSAVQIAPYFEAAKKMGFDITVHADQFTVSGSKVAVDFKAVSADHLEASGQKEIDVLAASDTIATALPGASLGLGCRFAPARQLLDAGCCLAIATDWNPGSAPMGDLVTQASILATFEKLSNAEVWAGITFRAAAALGFNDRGVLAPGFKADFNVYHTNTYKEIIYQQGRLKPSAVWKNGDRVHSVQ